jgi:hypothetical protein
MITITEPSIAMLMQISIGADAPEQVTFTEERFIFMSDIAAITYVSGQKKKEISSVGSEKIDATLCTILSISATNDVSNSSIKLLCKIIELKKILDVMPMKIIPPKTTIIRSDTIKKAHVFDILLLIFDCEFCGSILVSTLHSL